MPHILLRSSWQTVNIGDIAHTPGMLKLIERHLPGWTVTLLAGSVDNGVAELLRSNCPNLTEILTIRDDASHAIRRADVLIHGSGPSLVGEPEVRKFRELAPGKPWGVLGITQDHVSPPLAELLNSAAFVYTRESASLRTMREAGVNATGLFPDATFACNLRDDAGAEAFLLSAGLERGEFICVLPRYRRTPYYRIHPNPAYWTAQRVRELDELNATHAEPDHAKMRQVMMKYVRETGRKVLVCPEMEYQLAIQRPLLIDPLPEDVKRHVVERTSYWLTDLAASVYTRSAGVVSFECHSPILAAVSGVTGVYVRQPEDTQKGQMYPDFGLEDRIFQVTPHTPESLAAAVVPLLLDPAAGERTQAARLQIEGLHRAALLRLAEKL
jgi:uncharacterized protein YbbK (DUF523 family)